MDTISVVIPTLNEEKGIDLLMNDLHKVTKIQNYKIRIIIVDGGSYDKTVHIAKNNGVEVVFQNGKGYGNALITGFQYALEQHYPSVLVMMDGDGTYDPADIPNLIQPIINDEADFVVGNRFWNMDKGAMSKTNKVGNRILSKMSKMFLKTKVHDTQTGFRAFKAKLFQDLKLKESGMPFAIELLVRANKLGARISEQPVAFHRRIGKTKLKPMRDGTKILVTIIKLWLNENDNNFLLKFTREVNKPFLNEIN